MTLRRRPIGSIWLERIDDGGPLMWLREAEESWFLGPEILGPWRWWHWLSAWRRKARAAR